MPEIVMRIWRITQRALAIFSLFTLLFFIIFFILGWWKVNGDFAPCDSDDCVTIYIHSNDVHTDIVVPVNHSVKDWREFIDPSLTKAGNADFQWVAFGWGDKGFYLDTPEWSDLKVSTALVAMFYLGTSAMHVTFHPTMEAGELCKMVTISPTAYQQLIDYIHLGFVTNGDNQPQLIPNAAYGSNDLFFEGQGAYSLVYTCNSWANGCLKAGGLPACAWALLDKDILAKYK